MLLKRMGLPVTRENYLRVSFMGNPPEEPLDGEIEAEIEDEIPREILAAEKRAIRRDDQRFLRDVGIKK